MVFLVQAIIGFFMIPSFFKIGRINLLQKEKDSEQLIILCGQWYRIIESCIQSMNIFRFTAFTLMFPVLAALNACMIFARYVYVCYAADLASGGEQLFKILINLLILALCLPWVIIYPIIGSSINFKSFANTSVFQETSSQKTFP